MSEISGKARWLAGGCIVILFLSSCFTQKTPEAATAQPFTQTQPRQATPAPRLPVSLPIADDPLKESLIAAAEYLIRQQLPNGELSYQVQIFTGARQYSPSHARLVGGTGALYAACRVSGDVKYCAAGDLALKHYLSLMVSNPLVFKGSCLYAEGSCALGAAALTVDAIYKRWLAAGSLSLDEISLLDAASNLGDFIVAMQKHEGGFYHALDPHVGGGPNPDYFVPSSSGQALLALFELYEMTGDAFWLKQAEQVNAFMVAQRVTEDQWHCYALAKAAQIRPLAKLELDFAKALAGTVEAGEVRSLHPNNTSISAATKIEAYAALAQTFVRSGVEHEWLDERIRTFVTFVQARQLPNNNCGWDVTRQGLQNFAGGIFSTCEEPSIRVDGMQNWINGITSYLEYKGMIK